MNLIGRTIVHILYLLRLEIIQGRWIEKHRIVFMEYILLIWTRCIMILDFNT